MLRHSTNMESTTRIGKIHGEVFGGIRPSSFSVMGISETMVEVVKRMIIVIFLPRALDRIGAMITATIAPSAPMELTPAICCGESPHMWV